MTFLIDGRRIRRHRSWSVASDIGMMRPVRHPRHQTAADEDRSHERQIVQVRPSCVRIVHGVLHIRLDIGTESLDHGSDRSRHRAKVHRDVLGLGKHLTRRNEHSSRAGCPFLDVVRVGSSPQNDAHVVGNRRQAIPYDLQCDRVDRHHSTTSAPLG